MVEYVKVAFGTGAVLGLWRGQLASPPTTAHFLTYYENRCSANCKFCPQARESTSGLQMLSRVLWPRFEFEKVLVALGNNLDEFKRVCVQAVNYPRIVEELCEIIGRIKNVCDLPISVSCQPLGANDMKKLADSGAERVSVALDAATPELFDKIKGDGYTWDGHIEALDNAKAIFGDRVSTHLIVGLGETEEEMARTIQFLHDRGIAIGLFAFTPVTGTPLSSRPKPDVASYRRIQLARFLIVNDMSRAERTRFESGRIVDLGAEKDLLGRAIASGEPFLTSGCPDCNRPFYNESPRGPVYNYPRKLTSKEITVIQGQIGNL